MTKQQFLAMSLPYKLAISVISPFNSERRFEEWLTAMNYDQHYQTATSKPILHPLSDLTKEIQHNGEKFVPCIKIGWCKENDLDLFVLLLGNKKQKDYKLSDALKLIEWHFNLMDENEPFFDVNTLSENPY